MPPQIRPEIVRIAEKILGNPADIEFVAELIISLRAAPLPPKEFPRLKLMIIKNVKDSLFRITMGIIATEWDALVYKIIETYWL